MERKVFTYKDLEEAKKYIGKRGRFSENLFLLEKDHLGEPEDVLEHVGIDGFPFKARGMEYYQFFSPDPEPVEKWVPFTAEDFPSLLGRGLINRHSKVGAMVGCFNTAFWITCHDQDHGTSPEELLRDWTFVDGTPCGKRVKE